MIKMPETHHDPDRLLTAAEKFEAGMRWLRPDALSEATAQYGAHEIGELFPAAVERLRAFQVTPVTKAVPTNVAQYAREACRCYLYGLFSASLTLSRSCVESGNPRDGTLRDRMPREARTNESGTRHLYE